MPSNLNTETQSLEAARTLWGGEVGAQAGLDQSIRGRSQRAEEETVFSRPPQRQLETPDSRAGKDQPSDFQILRLLGQGGMGVVYSARQVSLNREIALKMIRPEEASNPQNVHKFLTEAVVTGRLDHPNIVPVYDVCGTSDGRVFYAMKEVSGTSWARVLREKTVEQNLRILLSACDAVAFAHARKVLHRDLKPENVMLGEFGEVMVMDWGLAYVFGETARRSMRTRLAGTPAYMAPEMAKGREDMLCPASDIYLLGGILYEIVTGLRPHTGKDIYACIAAAAANQIQPTDCKGELLDVARKALATDPINRYLSVKDFQQAIRDYLSHSESLTIALDCEARLAKLSQTEEHALYREATEIIAGFQQAIRLWAHNAPAMNGLRDARQALAEIAIRRGDLELARSEVTAAEEESRRFGMFDKDRDVIAALQRRLRRAMAERRSRRRLLVASVSVAVLAGLAALLITAQAYVVTRKGKERAESAERKAMEDRDRAVAAETEITRQHETLKKAFSKIEQDNYYSSITVAERRLRESQSGRAEDLLWSTEPTLRGWEWGALVSLSRHAFRVLPSEASAPQAVSFSPDGEEALAVGLDSRVRVWKIATGRLRTTLDTEPAPVVAAVFAADNRRILTCARDGALQAWDRDTGDKLSSRTMRSINTSVTALAFSPTGKYLLAAGNRQVDIWTTEDGKSVVTVPLPDVNEAVSLVALCPDAQTFLIQTMDEAPSLRSIRDGHVVRLLRLENLTSPLVGAVFTADGRRLLGTSRGMAAVLWDVETGEILQQLSGHEDSVLCAAIRPDGRQALTGSNDRTLRFWDIQAGDALASLSAHTGGVGFISFSQDGRQMATASDDGTMKIWNVARGSVALSIPGHEGGAVGAAFLSDGKRVLTADRSGTLRLWQISDGSLLMRVGSHGEPITSFAAVPSAERAVTAGNTSVRTWDLKKLLPLATLKMDRNAGRHVCLSPDGTRFAAVDFNATVWNTVTGEKVARFSGSGSAMNDVEFSPDGTRLITADRRGIQVWDVAAGRCLFAPGNGPVNCLAITPDGSRLVTGERGRLTVWDLAGGVELVRLRAHQGWVRMLAFSPDTRYLVSGGDDATVKLWYSVDPATPRSELDKTMGEIHKNWESGR